jgi:hypothetical protein
MDKSLTGIPLSRGSCKKPLRYCSSGCIKIVHAFALSSTHRRCRCYEGKEAPADLIAHYADHDTSDTKVHLPRAAIVIVRASPIRLTYRLFIAA